MFGLPVDTDVTTFEASVLTFVGVGRHQLQLAFSGQPDCSVSVEGDFVVSGPHQPEVRHTDPVVGAAVLLPLLGEAVVSAGVPEDGTFRLVLSGGTVVDVLDSEEGYESYQLRLGDRLVVV